MSSMFQATIIGRLTKDPEQKVPASGNAYTRMRLAWTQKKDEPGYIDSTLFGKTGEIAAQYLRKGSHICIAGARVEWREYEDKDGVKRQAYSLTGGDLIMLGKKDDEESTPSAKPTLDASDDDVPF